MWSRRHLAPMVVAWTALFFAPVAHRAAGRSPADPSRPAAAGGRSSSESRLWPLDIPIHLSSSFGEFREGHLHAGLDIRSFGREGIPCRSVGSGYVARLRASPSGYGQAVYIRLDRGETVVYAHLSEFAPRIDSVVWAAQVEKGRYQVDIDLAPGRLPVAQGEVIAYTGRTGAAAPHLHFEVREAGDTPVNPLDDGWVLQDDMAPAIRRVECLPLTPDARINGRCAPAVVELRPVGPHTFIAPETLTVTGTIGFGAQVIDRADDSSGALAPYRVVLEMDGERISTIEMKRFTYDQTPELQLVYDIASARTKGRHYLLLFRREGETIADRVFVDDGVIRSAHLSSGEKEKRRVHVAVVRASDYAGNVSTASVPFVVSTSTATPRASGIATAGGVRTSGRGEIPGFYFFDGLMSVRTGIGAELDSVAAPDSGRRASVSIEHDRDGFVLSRESVGESGRTLRLRSGDKTDAVHIVAARRAGGLRREFADIGVGLAVTGGSLYSDELLYLASWDRDPGETLVAGAGTRALTPGVRLGPISAALKSAIEIRFAAPGAPVSNAAVFRFDERKREWSLRPSQVRGDSVCSLVREPGVYAVLVDSLAPEIGAPGVGSRTIYATGSVSREVVVPIVDRGCGVDPERSEVYLDGKKQIARWDGFLEKMFVILRDKSTIGVHDLSVVAVDLLGNSTRLVTQLNIPPPATKGGMGGVH